MNLVSVWNKIKKNIDLIILDWRRDVSCFSLKLAIVRLLSTICRFIRIKRLSNILTKKKDDLVIEYLEQKYAAVFKKTYHNPQTKGLNDLEHLPIWVCWLDGLKDAPPLVQRCVNSIYQHAGNHPVHLVTFDNIESYISIPTFMYKKIEIGEMGLAHFSDYIRVSLLEKYGGLWLDSTIFCASDIPESYFGYEVFTCKSNELTPGCVSNNRWTTFCLGGQKGTPLFKTLKSFFEEYWENEKYAIDYLFFDDAIELAQRYSKKIEETLQTVPDNNENRDRLMACFADSWEMKVQFVTQLLASDTVLYKLGYRESHYLKDMNDSGKETVYSAFINNRF